MKFSSELSSSDSWPALASSANQPGCLLKCGFCIIFFLMFCGGVLERSSLSIWVAAYRFSNV